MGYEGSPRNERSVKLTFKMESIVTAKYAGVAAFKNQ